MKPITRLLATGLLTALPLLVLGVPASAQDDADDRLTLDLYLEWEGVSSAELSPDGREILYRRQWIDGLEDERESTLWIMNADGTRNRALLDGSSPTWSPDGERIAFLDRDDNDRTQIFVRWMDDEGAVSQVTRVEKSPSSLAWSPDGEWIAFRMTVPDTESWSIDLPRRPEGAQWTESPRIIESLDYSQDRRGFLEEGWDHVFVVPAEGGTPRQLTDGDWDHGSPEWTPDGSEILFSSLRVEDAEYEWRESEIYAVDVESGRIRQLTERHGLDQGPVVSPDGRRVAYTGHDWTDDTYYESRLYVMGIDGSSPREIATNLERSPREVTWAPDGSGVFFSADSEGTRNLWFAPLNGDARPVTTGEHMLSVDDIADSGVAVGTRSSFHEPGDIVSFHVDRPDRIEQLTAVNADVLAGRELGEVEEIRYESTDGLEIQGWVITPPGFDASERHPLMLVIHGGPHAMYNVGFNFGWQEHAANGYVVLYTNPRGSSGYGSEFGNEIDNAYPGRDYDDLMAGVDAVLARGYVDEDRMFVYGCSGGGVLTAWIVGHTDRFAAASSNCPVTNWLSFVGTTDGPNWYRNFEEMPWDDPTEHLERSPLMYVGNVTTPTMLMTGENDLRTPIAQTEEFYQALKMMRVPTAMIRFNEEWHGTSSRPSNFLRTQLYLRNWFERWGDPDGGGSP